MIYYLLYISYATQNFDEADLRSLLSSCQQNNKRLNITGIMLHIEGKFIQLLEGPKDRVISLFEKIENDPRHKKVNVALEGTTHERMFPDWKMALKVLDNEEFKELSGYSDIEEFFTQDQIDNKSHPAKIFLRLFYQKNYRDFADIG